MKCQYGSLVTIASVVSSFGYPPSEKEKKIKNLSNTLEIVMGQCISIIVVHNLSLTRRTLDWIRWCGTWFLDVHVQEFAKLLKVVKVCWCHCFGGLFKGCSNIKHSKRRFAKLYFCLRRIFGNSTGLVFICWMPIFTAFFQALKEIWCLNKGFGLKNLFYRIGCCFIKTSDDVCS